MKMKKIRVAVLLYGDLYALNGASLYVKRFSDHASYFDNAGISLCICAGNYDPSLKRRSAGTSIKAACHMNTKIKRFKKKVKQILPRLPFGSALMFYLAFLQNAKHVVKRFKKEIREADSLLVNDIWTAYYVHKYMPEKKMIFIMHNSGDLYSMLYIQLPKLKRGAIHHFLARIQEEIFACAARIVFVSETAAEKFREGNVKYADKAVFIPVGLEPVECRYKHTYDKIEFVSTGTVCTRKNQIALIQAMEKLKDPSAVLTIVGGGPALSECRRYVKEHHIQNVVLTGPVENILGYLDEANVFISASLDEGVPATGVEALRNGLPIIIGDVGGCSELIAHNGMLIHPDKHSEILESMERIIRNKEELENMSRNSRKLYEEKYHIEGMFDLYIRLIKELAAQAPFPQ